MCMVHVALTIGPINHHTPTCYYLAVYNQEQVMIGAHMVVKIRSAKKVARAYCPNMYCTKKLNIERQNMGDNN